LWFVITGFLVVDSGLWPRGGQDRSSEPELSQEEKERRLIKNDLKQRLERKAEKIAKTNAEHMKKVRAGQARDLDLARHYSLGQDDCQSLQKPEMREKCRQYTRVKSSIDTHEFAECDKLDKQKWQDICIHQVSQHDLEGKWRQCLDIRNKMMRDSCLQEYAIKLDDFEICARMTRGADSCVARTRANNNTDGDITKCRHIQNAEYFMMCVKSSRGDCSELERYKQCESARHFDRVITEGDPKYCQILPLESYRRTCELYFENGQEFTDTDGDGVKNNQELFVGTDPFEAEEEASVRLGYETQWKQVMEHEYFQLQDELKGLRVDSDADGLRDYLEENVYNTDKDKADTDGDGYTDGEEVEAGYDPTEPS